MYTVVVQVPVNEVKLEAFDTPDCVKHSEMYVYMLPFTVHVFLWGQ